MLSVSCCLRFLLILYVLVSLPYDAYPMLLRPMHHQDIVHPPAQLGSVLGRILDLVLVYVLLIADRLDPLVRALAGDNLRRLKKSFINTVRSHAHEPTRQDTPRQTEQTRAEHSRRQKQSSPNPQTSKHSYTVADYLVCAPLRRSFCCHNCMTPSSPFATTQQTTHRGP